MTHRRALRFFTLLLVALLGLLAGCGQPTAQTPTSPAPTVAPPTEAPAAPTTVPAAAPVQTPGPDASAVQTLRLATTTSTADSGLLDVILPDFEQRYNAKIEVIAVGTGQALELGERGDVDVVLVHARAREDAFVQEGYGVDRRDVMYNDFVIVGPEDDPAEITGLSSAKEAFAAIASAEAPFASRGDDSGTHTKEKSIWASAAITPTAEMSWYKSLGQGMGETLITANELGAYTITDRGTFLATQEHLPNLVVLLGGASVAENQDAALRNPYGVIPVNPEKHPTVNNALAEEFVTWLTSPETQAAIGEFGRDRYGQPLFYPSAGG